MNFFTELKRRNELLFWFGLFNLAVAIACLIRCKLYPYLDIMFQKQKLRLFCFPPYIFLLRQAYFYKR